jgi:hypothetical protein
MENEAQLIAAAVMELKQEPNLLKDYIFPIASSFLSALLGGLVAWFTIRYQNTVSIEESKVDSANKWILLGHGVRSELLTIKGHYNGKLSSTPLQRVTVVPPILPVPQAVTDRPYELMYITPKKNSGCNSKWNQVIRIETLFMNFNALIAIIEERNGLQTGIFNSLESAGYTQNDSVSLEDLIALAGEKDVTNLIDLTETMIHLIDTLLIEVDSFIKKFPDLAEKKITQRYINSGRMLLNIDDTSSPMIGTLIGRTPEPDYTLLAAVLGKPAEQLRDKYFSGYE